MKLSKYQDENAETQRLEINNNENGHNRYSGHNWCIYPILPWTATFNPPWCIYMRNIVKARLNILSLALP